MVSLFASRFYVKQPQSYRRFDRYTVDKRHRGASDAAARIAFLRAPFHSCLARIFGRLATLATRETLGYRPTPLTGVRSPAAAGFVPNAKPSGRRVESAIMRIGSDFCNFINSPFSVVQQENIRGAIPQRHIDVSDT